MPSRGASRLALLAVGVVLGGLAFAAGIALLSDKLLANADQMASVVGLPVAVMGLLLTVRSITVARRGASGDETMAVSLTRQLRKDWGSELYARHLVDSDLIATRYEPADGDIGASVKDVETDPATNSRTKVTLSGTLTDLGDRFRELPRGRLVILGEAGTGKSVLAMALTVQLLDRRKAGQPVPILLSMTGWPPSLDLRGWLTGQLAENNLGGYAGLLDSGLLLPVLDGLDELGHDEQDAAYEALCEAAAQGEKFAMTCRTAAYADVVHRSGRRMPGAAVIGVRPLTADLVSSYLDGDAWRPVRMAITADPPTHPAVAEVLRTPLMAHLARTAYGVPGADPADLLDLHEVEELRGCLLAAYLPALYHGSGAPPSDRLRFLARKAGETFSWWTLHRTVRRWPDRVAALTCGVLTAASILLSFPSFAFEPMAVTAPTALFLGFLGPAGDSPRPLAGSLLRIGLVVAVPVVLILGTAEAIDGGWSTGFVVFVLLSSLLVAVSYHLGRVLAALAAAPWPIDAALCRRTLLGVVLFGLAYLPMPLSGAEIAALVGMALAGAAAAAFVRVDERPVPPDSLMTYLRALVRLGAPVAVAAATATAMSAIPTRGLDLYFPLYLTMVAVPAALATGTLAVVGARGAAPPTTVLKPAWRAGIAAALVFAVLFLIFTVAGVVDGSPPGDYIPFALVFSAVVGGMVFALVLIARYVTPSQRDLDRSRPTTTLRRDRRAVLIIAGTSMPALVFSRGDVFGVGCLILVMVLISGGTRWPAFAAARLLLAGADRKLPWRIMAFLADAHDRGVLRRVGAAYQFRHEHIRRYLRDH
ncbi:hypothetical protein Ade02nite_47190 [Paractinoplanes deccanensis]|uniref:NACHT domain-containing protein n=1 Tax=Paractinoplanes deccanensis TaxID=113561 RepID=A0ABQ3Y7X4_9ACTN|nr:hypothetical protein [Actinoplanes deccanensis]GID76078.1 hypothetical protein Ade02nite_47190 [Actinoplanes deccanensis]